MRGWKPSSDIQVCDTLLLVYAALVPWTEWTTYSCIADQEPINHTQTIAVPTLWNIRESSEWPRNYACNRHIHYVSCFIKFCSKYFALRCVVLYPIWQIWTVFHEFRPFGSQKFEQWILKWFTLFLRVLCTLTIWGLFHISTLPPHYTFQICWTTQ